MTLLRNDIDVDQWRRLWEMRKDVTSNCGTV